MLWHVHPRGSQWNILPRREQSVMDDGDGWDGDSCGGDGDGVVGGGGGDVPEDVLKLLAEHGFR